MVDFLHAIYRRRRIILILAGLAVAVFGVAKLAGYIGDMISSRNTNEEMRRIYYETIPPAETETPAPTAPGRQRIPWQSGPEDRQSVQAPADAE